MQPLTDRYKTKSGACQAAGRELPPGAIYWIGQDGNDFLWAEDEAQLLDAGVDEDGITKHRKH